VVLAPLQLRPVRQPGERATGVPNPVGWKGEPRDANGQIYLRARYYDPAIGRFLSRDPLPGAMWDPGSQNAYAYAGNNPVTRSDPSGMFAPFAVGALVLFGGGEITISGGTVLAGLGLLGAAMVGAALGATNALGQLFAKEAPDPSELKKLGSGEEEKLAEVGGAHEVKKGIVGEPVAPYDLFKDRDGDIYVLPKSGRGEPQETGYNINEFD